MDAKERVRVKICNVNKNTQEELDLDSVQGHKMISQRQDFFLDDGGKL